MTLVEFTTTAGYIGVAGIIFSESGLLLGIFFPGDSLLFTAGFLASQGFFNVGLLVGLCFVAAVGGDSVGYAFGKRVGKRFFRRPDSFWLNPGQVERAQAFYARHGGKAILLARFIPGIRTLAPILAGIGDMRYAVFLSFNVIGGLLWAVGITLLGYFLGSTIPKADRYLLPFVLLVAGASLIPYGVELLRKPEQRKALYAYLEQAWNSLKKH